MAIIDADVLLSIWCNESQASACLHALAQFNDESSYITDLNTMEVLLRSHTLLKESFENGLGRIKKIAAITSLAEEELLLASHFRVSVPKLDLGDAYAAAVAVSRKEMLVSTDKRFLRIKELDPFLHLVTC